MEITLELKPYNCCGGGHCGPLPGYFFICPKCDEDALGKTYYPLEEKDTIRCNMCRHELTVIKKNSDTQFTFTF